MRISLYEHLCTDTLRHRETALEVINEIDKAAGEDIVIDFSKIRFASRAFCHELMSGLRCRRNVRLEHLSPEVQSMVDALDRPKLRLSVKLAGDQNIIEATSAETKARVVDWGRMARSLKADAMSEGGEESHKWVSREYVRKKLGLS